MATQRKIVILGVGGTIAGQGAALGGGVGYLAGQIGVADLSKPVAELLTKEGVLIDSEQVAQLDSKDMDAATWQQLAAACQRWLLQDEVVGLVITHGTDTLEETAWFLQCVLQPVKPVVLTCAMRPATALSADGPANLRDAVACANDARAGVWAVVAGEVHSAHAVRKVHPYRLQAFSSAAEGPAGWIEEGRVRWAGVHSSRLQTPVDAAAWQQAVATWPWVEIVMSTAAANPAAVDALVLAGVKGLVVAATGNGSVHHVLQQALTRAQQQGVCVWRTTRCEQGQLVLAKGEDATGTTALSPVKARISLMLELLQRAQVRSKP